ncbi:uncharacterized protein N7487_000749 [Penicillium crustosum]|uniref:uncharacterized protein n=1 Tax=Penicillium crustosum TaxID=36656 RepID=UPI0023980BDD|nr:uncharacterized protein N7487_000749 [Penicillium crustosum]KAJ5417199.1 hypothetical protein N7487_000749 [Penicillium crustosum]
MSSSVVLPEIGLCSVNGKWYALHQGEGRMGHPLVDNMILQRQGRKLASPTIAASPAQVQRTAAKGRDEWATSWDRNNDNAASRQVR